jgi:hydrogenase maturation factor
VRVLVEVAGSSGVGLTILEDGLLVYDQVTSSGFSEEFEAEEAITVTAADAGSVRVGVDGDDPEVLGASGEQVTRTFTAEA